MKLMKNQTGYTLLLTLLLIVLVFGFIGSLMFSAITQQTQVEKTDEKFLLSDITAMGVEYYRGKIINNYVTVASNVKSEVELKLKNAKIDEYKTEESIRELEQNEEELGMIKLLGLINNYTFDPVSKDEVTTLFFQNKEPTIINNETSPNVFITFFITAKHLSEEKNSSFKISIPRKMIIVQINTEDGGSIDNSNTIQNPNFTIPPNTKDCNGNYTNNKCTTSGIKKIGNIDNSTIYYLGDLDSIPANKSDFNKSNIYVLGNLNAGNLKDIDNLSLFVNGDAEFHQISATFFNLFTSGDILFDHFTTFTNSKIRSLGKMTATFKGVKLNKSHMLLEGINNDLDIKVEESSTLCIKENSRLNNLYIDSTSNVYIIDSATRTGANSSGSKLPQVVDLNTFNEKCYGVSDEIGVIIDTTTTITPESILDEIKYDLPIVEESP
jgi:hypothetical protein